MDVHAHEVYLLLTLNGEVIPIAGIALTRVQSNEASLRKRLIGGILIENSGSARLIEGVRIEPIKSDSLIRNILNRLFSLQVMSIKFSKPFIINEKELSKEILKRIHQHGKNCLYWEFDIGILQTLVNKGSPSATLENMFRSMSVPGTNDVLDVF